MKRQHRFVVVGALGVLVLGAVVLLATRHSPLVTQAGKSKATYYCPMHPTYTSDRPGNCPICQMKLAKAEQDGPSAGAVATQGHDGHGHASEQFQSICYLHNCPKLHEGQPCPMTVVAKPGEKVICPICGMHVAEASPAPAQRKILYWTDPMIPGYRAEGPGKSPMGMDLVPVYEEEAGAGMSPRVGAPAGYAPVLLTPQKQQLIGVKTATVERRPLTKTIRTAGVIAHDPELYQTQAEYIKAVQALEQAKQSGIPDVVDQAQRLVESTQIRLRHLGLSDELIQEIATWKEPEHSLLFSHPGEPVWMYAQVYEYELPLVHVGQELTVEVPALPDQLFHGVIRAIDPMVEPMTRTTRIRAQLQDPQGQLKPEMYVTASIAINLGEVVAVPEEAVFTTGEKHMVFIDKGQGLFEPRDVTTGVKADGYDEIKSGLDEREVVVTSGNFLIDSESRLKGALQNIGGGEHRHGQ